jgi:hypothetical protein
VAHFRMETRIQSPAIFDGGGGTVIEELIYLAALAQIPCYQASIFLRLAGTVDLGFIDGAHALPYVVSDTQKMAAMIQDKGLVLWHDYGGVGEFRLLSEYLEKLAAAAPVWRIPRTSTAWCLDADLKKAITQV